MIKTAHIMPLVLTLLGLLGLGAQEAHAQTALWYDDQGGPISGPSVTNLLGCPLDHMRHVARLPQLVGSWNIVNQTSSGIDRNLTGIMTFSRNGTMEFRLPTSVVYGASGDTSDTMLWVSWGVNENGHLLTFSSDNAVNMTFMMKSPDYMELVDSHGDRIHLTRYWLANQLVVAPTLCVCATETLSMDPSPFFMQALSKTGPQQRVAIMHICKKRF